VNSPPASPPASSSPDGLVSPGPGGPAPSTRERLIDAMAAALQRRGLHGVGLNELLAEAGAPKGVLYHHFPGGKVALAVAAIERVVDRLASALDRVSATGGNPLPLLRQWLLGAQRQLEASRFERGCPLATVALESTADDQELRQALARGFATLRERLAVALSTAGLAAPRSRAVAALIVSAYEGALMQARVAGDIAPMQDAADTLLELLQRELDGARRPPPAPPADPPARPTPRRRAAPRSTRTSR
jgi:TetR/AcrR family transcriptional regulator, lmrAB and yxaGH operons repressor